MRIKRIRATLIDILIRNKIASQTVHCFESLKNVEHKINSIEVLLKSYHLLSDIPIKSQKCNKKARTKRKEGNQYFAISNRNLCKAMELYNESICHAENDSEDLAYGFANRSAIYFEWNDWEKCLSNIVLSRQCKNFPNSLKLKLEKREVQCREGLNKCKGNYFEYVHSLSYQEHNQVPGIVYCLKLKQNEKYGRHIVATKDLNVGDVIAIENPFMLSLEPNFEYQRCLYCLAEQKFSLIPCLHCTHSMFCNESCRNKGYNLFHKFECSVIYGIFDVFDNSIITALRSILKLFSNTDELIKVKNFFATPRATEENIFTVNANSDSIFEQFKAVLGLETHLNKREKADKFQHGITAATLICIMKNDENFVKLFDNGFSNLFYELIYQIIQAQEINTISILLQTSLKDKELNNYATGIFPFSSLINHSCNPNVLSFGCNNNQYTIIVSQKINKGEQLFTNYV